MRSDQEIYNDIGSVLLSISPSDASKIILCATLDPASDCGEFTYDYVDKSGSQHWVTETSNASEQLLDLLVELRNYFLANFKSQEKPFWHGCEVTVDVETLKIHIDFKYNN
ncbi:immunity protein YezG family protein [Serratia microhaemolytica]|uniref:immunity protein YezG family protein n=1 Tax=Serratia microhaemolytica TaxID=2675110 RepID=UPI000FDE616B|nr:immunity protein YezG family protein [Serratia microhaemolytica]